MEDKTKLCEIRGDARLFEVSYDQDKDWVIARTVGEVADFLVSEQGWESEWCEDLDITDVSSRAHKIHVSDPSDPSADAEPLDALLKGVRAGAESYGEWGRICIPMLAASTVF